MEDRSERALASVETSYVITRADGTVIDLGVTGFSHRSRWRRLWWRAVRRPLADRRVRAANRDAAKRAASTSEEA
jgi:hypothetical protein